MKTSSDRCRHIGVDGTPGVVWSQGGRPRIVFGFTFQGAQIVSIDLIDDPDRLGQLDLLVDPSRAH